MRTTIFLSKEHPSYAQLQAMLSEELRALPSKGITITLVATPPPEDTLAFGEVAQVLIDHKEEVIKYLPFLTATIQILNTILQRLSISPKKTPKKQTGAKSKRARKQTLKGSAVILQTNDKTLELPCSDERARSFIKRVTQTRQSKVRRHKD